MPSRHQLSQQGHEPGEQHLERLSPRAPLSQPPFDLLIRQQESSGIGFCGQYASPITEKQVTLLSRKSKKKKGKILLFVINIFFSMQSGEEKYRRYYDLTTRVRSLSPAERCFSFLLLIVTAIYAMGILIAVILLFCHRLLFD